MDVSFEQRQLLNSLYKFGYIGNWYKLPNKTFLKVYLVDEKKDIYMRLEFDKRLNVVNEMVHDPTTLFNSASPFEEKFNNVLKAIRDISSETR